MLLNALHATSIIGGFLIVGYLVVRLPVLRRAFLPGSLIAGLLLLLAGPQVAGNYFSEFQISGSLYDFWRLLPKQLINVVFACLFLARPVKSLRAMWKLAGPQVAFGQMIAWGQYALGGILTLFVLIPFFQSRPLVAALIEISFEGGHGTVSGLSPVFEQLGFRDGQELALGLATISLCTALVSGVALVNWGKRKGHIKTIKTQSLRERIYHRRIIYELHKQGVSLRNHLTPKWLMTHLILIALSIGIAWLIYQGLIITEKNTWAANGGPQILRYIPFFPFCMFGGMIGQALWSKAGFSTSRPLIELLSSIALSVLIASAVATMSLTYIGNNLAVFGLLAVVGILWIVLSFVLLAPRMFKTNWFQNGIVNAAQSMGMTATGLLFLHMVDPQDKTSAAESFGFKQLMFEPFVGGGIVTALSMPAIIFLGLPTFTIITSAICLVWMLLGIIYFGRR